MSLRDLFSEVATRVDSWMNLAMGFGGVSDKFKQTKYSGYVKALTDAEITAMYRTEHLAAKIVDVYPKEAYREGIELAGFDDESESESGAAPEKDEAKSTTGNMDPPIEGVARPARTDADEPPPAGVTGPSGAKPKSAKKKPDVEEQCRNVLEQWNVLQLCTQAAIWGRAYGGAKVWIGSYSADPSTPFVEGEKIDFLRVIDRRSINPRPWALDDMGEPTLYDIFPVEGGPGVGPIHASRLIHFPGALTDDQTRIQRDHWDDSVLQRPYEALQADGVIWRSAQQLLSEASIGVLKIKGLYGKLSGPARELIENRLAFFNATRSVARNMTLDADGEDYKRENTTFAGVSDLAREAITRVASAAEIPVAILLSDEPSGLNATGDSSIRWWLMRVHAYRVAHLQKPTLQLCRAVLAQAGIADLKVEKLSLKWPLLWTPSAKEQSEIYSTTATADEKYFSLGILSADEIAKSRFGQDGYSQETTIDRTRFEEPTEDDLLEAAAAPLPEDGATGATGGAEPAPAAVPGEGPAGANVQDQVLNGTQVTALVDIVARVSSEEIPRDAGVQIIMLSFQVDQARAEQLMGSAGKGFTAKPEPPPFGGPGAPPPFGKKPDDAPSDEAQTPEKKPNPFAK